MDDLQLVRGTDLRSKTVGMTLVIDRGVESMREAQQMLARVGRYGERCTRLLVAGVKLVDSELNLALKARLISYYTPETVRPSGHADETRPKQQQA